MAVNLERLDKLITDGETLLGAVHTRPRIRSDVRFVDAGAFQQWRMSSLSFLDVSFSKSSDYYQNFLERCSFDYETEAGAGLAILKAVKDDNAAEIVPTNNTVDISTLPLHPRIAEVSLDLYADGHYDDAVLAASKSLINFVKEKSRRDDIDGAGLMTEVFSQKNPTLAFNELINRSDLDEQQGMMHLFQGAVLAIRNPRGHDFPDDGAERAMEYISFISMLAKFVSESRKV